MSEAERIARALRDTLTSPNVLDSNWEAANVVDALDRIAHAGFAVAKAIDRLAAVHAGEHVDLASGSDER